MTEKEKWQALLNCDSMYDGRFYYGLKTTGIFCRPSCKSKSPRRENVLFFDTAEQASIAGLRPCKRCRPDLLEFEPQKEIANQIKHIYEQCYFDRKRLKNELAALGLNRNRIAQLFKQEYNMTEIAFLNQIRIREAKRLLLDTQDTILQVALQSGFDSSSNFYSQFQKIVGMSPNQYRISNTTK